MRCTVPNPGWKYKTFHDHCTRMSRIKFLIGLAEGLLGPGLPKDIYSRALKSLGITLANIWQTLGITFRYMARHNEVLQPSPSSDTCQAVPNPGLRSPRVLVPEESETVGRPSRMLTSFVEEYDGAAHRRSSPRGGEVSIITTGSM